MPEEYSVRADRERLYMHNLIKWCDEKITFLKSSGIVFKNDFPVLPEDSYYTDIPAVIESFQFRNKIPCDIRNQSLICYFSPDERLVQRLYKIDEEIAILHNYAGICGFDLSPSVTMLRPRQRLSLLVNSLFNCYVALHGIKVLPNCRVGDLANMSVLNNISPFTNVISGEIGCDRNGLHNYGTYQLRITLKKLSPPVLFTYGGLSKQDIKTICGRTPQNFISYPSARDKYFNNKEAKARIWNGTSVTDMSINEFRKGGYI